MKDDTIEGTQIESTTKFDVDHGKNNARLGRYKAWRPLVNDMPQWLQVGVSIMFR